MARMRRRIGDGSATPSEIADFEASIQFRREVADQMLDDMIDNILAHRDEPSSSWGSDAAALPGRGSSTREGNVAEGSFHPDTHVISGGGAKGFDIPADHVEQIMQFMGLTFDNFTQGYGMQERAAARG